MNQNTLQKKRHNARRYAVQALYQWSFHEMTADRLLKEFIADPSMNVAEDIDKDYFKALVTGTVTYVIAIDERMSTCLDRSITALNPVELTVLRLAVYELWHQPDIPYKVVIDEALELAKEFGSQEGHKYVNGVLDALGPGLRFGKQ